MTLLKFKNATKPFWIPIITCVYVFNVENINLFVIIALFFGYVGDILLMFPQKKYFLAGGFSFLIGHLFYTYVFIIDAGGIGVFFKYPIFCIITLLPYLAVIVLMNKLFGKHIPSIIVPAACYLYVLLFMSYSAFLRFFNMPLSAAILTFSGSILFIVSDSFIAFRNFRRKFKGIEAVVVITYIAAQILIVSGLS